MKDGDRRNPLTVEPGETDDLVIELATADALRRVIKNPGSITVVTPQRDVYVNDKVDDRHPLGEFSLVTTKSSPAIIFDDAASYHCTPIITFDREGNALYIHTANFSSDTQKQAKINTGIDAYIQTLAQFVTGTRIVTCVAGGNYVEGESDPIGPFMQSFSGQIISVFPDANIYSFLTRQFGNSRYTNGIIPYDAKVLGLVFVPKYMASDNKNHLMPVISGNNQRIREYFGSKL